MGSEALGHLAPLQVTVRGQRQQMEMCMREIQSAYQKNLFHPRRVKQQHRLPWELGLTLHLPQWLQDTLLGAGFPRASILVLCSLVGIQFLLLCAFSTPASCKVSSTATTLVPKPSGAVMVRGRLHFCRAGIPESSPHIFHNSLSLS